MRRALMFSMIVAGLAASTPAAATSTPARHHDRDLRPDDRVERLADRLEFRADRLLDRVTERRWTGVDLRMTSSFQDFHRAAYLFWSRVREDGEFHHGTLRAWQDLQTASLEVEHVLRLSRPSRRVRNAWHDAAEELRRLQDGYGEEILRLERERLQRERHRPSNVVRYREAPRRGAVIRRHRGDRDFELRLALPGIRVRIGG